MLLYQTFIERYLQKVTTKFKEHTTSHTLCTKQIEINSAQPYNRNAIKCK